MSMECPAKPPVPSWVNRGIPPGVVEGGEGGKREKIFGRQGDTRENGEYRREILSFRVQVGVLTKGKHRYFEGVSENVNRYPYRE